MKIGINIKVNVSKIDKARIFEGAKGKYVDLVAFVDIDNQGQYGDNGTVSQKGEKGESLPIIGNVKVFWREQPKEQSHQGNGTSPEDSIPF